LTDKCDLNYSINELRATKKGLLKRN